MRFRAVVVVLMAVLSFAIGGCAPTPRDDSPKYRQILNANTTAIDFAEGEPLSLAMALAIANRTNETLAIEGEAYLRTIDDKRRTLSSILPSAMFSPTYSVREQSSGGGYDADLDLPIDAELVLFDGNQNLNAYWRDVYLIERQRDRLLEAQEQLLFDVIDVYYGILRAEAQVDVLQESLKVQGERLRDVEGRQRAGTARPLDVSQTQAQFAATRVQLVEAQRQVGDGRSALAYLLDRPVQESALTDGFTPGDATPPIEMLMSAARQYRSELAAAERSIAAAERDVKVAIGEYYPRVAIDLSAFLYRESVPDARTWESLLSVSFPLFSGGRIDANVRTAWSFLREAQLVLSQSTRRVMREVDQAVRDLNASREREAQLKIQLQAASDAFAQADASYKAGLATNLERVTAQDQMLQAQLALATEVIDQKTIRLSLLRAIGSLRESMLETPASTMPTTQP